MITISKDPIDPGAVLTAFEDELTSSGGMVSFSGRVRGEAASGTVKSLHLDAYNPMTERGIEGALDTAQRRWPLEAVRIIHRIGTMKPGETIVFVATASKHRRAAFEAADFLMDYLKTEAVFWKKEVTDTGETWIEPRQADYADSSRWTRKETV